MCRASKDQLDSLIQVVRISQDIKTSFRLGKYAVLEMRRGKQADSGGIDLPDDQHIGEIGRLQIHWHFTVRPKSEYQDESQNDIGVYQKSISKESRN